MILTQVVREAKHIQHNKQTTKSDNKVQAIQITVKDKTSEHSTAEENTSIQVSNCVIHTPKPTASSFNTYFLTTT